MRQHPVSGLHQRIDRLERSERVQRIKHREASSNRLESARYLLPDEEREAFEAFLLSIQDQVVYENWGPNLRALTDSDLDTLHRWAIRLKELQDAQSV